MNKMSRKPAASEDVDFTTRSLRRMLLAEIRLLQSGEGDRRRTASIVNTAEKVMATVRLELDVQRQMSLMAKAGLDPAVMAVRLD